MYQWKKLWKNWKKNMDSLENRKYKIEWLDSFKDELSQIYYYMNKF